MPNRDSHIFFDRARAITELQQLLMDTEDMTNFLDELARYAVETVAPGSSCGITLQRGTKNMTVASSDSRARGLDEVQYGHDQGPCLTAMRTGKTVVVEDMANEDRWGDYRADAVTHGIASVLSVALDGGQDLVGALNFYAGQPGVFGAEEQHLAENLTAEASRALRLAVRLTDQVQLARNLEVALASRSVIDQAVGVIMGQNRCSAAEAFEVLRRASNNRNSKLRDVATELVTRLTGEPPEPPHSPSSPEASRIG